MSEFDKRTSLHPMKCPKCGTQNDMATNINKEREQKPKVTIGSILVCFSCGTPVEWGDGNPRVLTVEETAKLFAEDSELKAALEAWNKIHKCGWCNEPVRSPISTAEFATGVIAVPLHEECALRMVSGGLAHMQKRCSCFGGPADDTDPPGMTRRQAARAAARYFHALQKTTAPGGQG